MKRGRIIKFGIALPIFLMVAAFAVVVWVGYSDREPSYQGKRLSEWAKLYSEYKVAYFQKTGNFQVSGEAPDPSLLAIRSMGTNALPHLLRMAGRKDSPIKEKIRMLLQKQTMVQVPFKRARTDRVLAIWGFDALGVEAKPAVPALIQLLDDEDWLNRVMVMKCLEKIGPAANEAVPALLRCAEDPNAKVRLDSLHALMLVHVPGDQVVPSLIKRLEELRLKRGGECVEIVSALAELGPDASAATPILLAFANDENSVNRRVATNALMRIAPDVAKGLVPQKPFEEEISPYIKRD